MATSTAAKETARAYRLRKLMRGPPDPTRQMESIQEIIDERIAELNAKLTPEGD